jgi:hypothetical protein
MKIEDYEFDFASHKMEIWGDLAHAVQQLYVHTQALEARIEDLESQLAKKPKED